MFFLLKTVIKIWMEFKKVSDALQEQRTRHTFFAVYEMHLISAKVKLFVQRLTVCLSICCGYLDSVYQIIVCLFTCFCLTVLSVAVTEFPPKCRPSKQHFSALRILCFSSINVSHLISFQRFMQMLG